MTCLQVKTRATEETSARKAQKGESFFFRVVRPKQEPCEWVVEWGNPGETGRRGGGDGSLPGVLGKDFPGD